MKTAILNLTFREISIIANTIDFYCNGPQYNKFKKDLTESEKDLCNEIYDRLVIVYNEIKKQYPELFESRPYSEEAKLKTGKIELTCKEIGLLIRLMKTTLQECDPQQGSDRDLPMLVGPYEAVVYCHQLLLDARRSIASEKV